MAAEAEAAREARAKVNKKIWLKHHLIPRKKQGQVINVIKIITIWFKHVEVLKTKLT
jgi:hypothetical protein